MALKATLRLESEDDVVRAASTALLQARAAGASRAEESALELVVRELAYNLIQHAGGGTLEIARLSESGQHGFVVECRDTGPGVAPAARPGVGLGLGLGAVQRQSREFTLVSIPGHGSRIRAVLEWP